MSDTLRTRIANSLFACALRNHTDVYWDDGLFWLEQADAVIRDVLTPEFLADLVIAAVQKAADNE